MLRVVVAHEARQLREAQRLRWQVYCEEERLLPESTLAPASLVDAVRAPETTQFLAYSEGEAVGTLSLTRARSSGLGEQSGFGLPLESKYELRGFERRDMSLAEVTGFCVLRRFRGSAAAGALFGALLVESERLGVTHWLAAANMQTDSADDAAIAHRLLLALGLLNPAFQAHARGPSSAPAQARRFFYTPEQRRCAARGELGALRLPRTLSLFASKMGARYIGPPVYHADFNVFALPLAVGLASLPERQAALASLCRRGPEPTQYAFGSIGPVAQ